MEVAREVEIDLLHRQHLRIAATCCTALHSEARPQRGFSQGHCSVLADLIQSQCQTDTDRGLADTGFRRADRGHKDQPTLTHFLLIDQRDRHLGHISSIGFDLFSRNTKTGGYFTDVIKFAFTRNLYIGLHDYEFLTNLTSYISPICFLGLATNFTRTCFLPFKASAGIG